MIKDTIWIPPFQRFCQNFQNIYYIKIKKTLKLLQKIGVIQFGFQENESGSMGGLIKYLFE